MTIIAKVGASYVDHMNDDTLEVDSFFRGCYQALLPPFLRREPGDEANPQSGSRQERFCSSANQTTVDSTFGQEN